MMICVMPRARKQQQQQEQQQQMLAQQQLQAAVAEREWTDDGNLSGLFSRLQLKSCAAVQLEARLAAML
eukprot:262975-Prymnesium_polylepis.1